ncbi:UDP-glucuronosyltransferase 2B33-like [Convolutriloba macropyga]|uniref:UDP-glucuronosyltransferase 2B33-like n=1 Tax=Convolutriloba macropyga TaxID=536237 RepID=UPI003F5269C3
MLQTIVASMFKNASSCSEAIMYTLEGVKVDNFIQGLYQVKEAFADNGTRVAFEKTHEYLEKNSNYDVIVTDYLIIGAHLAAEVHNIPVVTHYVGPLLITLESDPESFMSLIYIPETRMPKFVLNFFQFITDLVWQKVVSENVYAVVNEINTEYDMEPKLSNAKITYTNPYGYYYHFSHFIHLGPPDIFLDKLQFMDEQNNIRHVGYLPDETCFKPVKTEIENFVLRSDKTVVYMSLGTVFEMEISKLVNLIKDLAKQTKYSIIWSASGLYYDELKSRNIDGPNFMLTTKVAQLSLLMMKEVKVFLTHAGANSLQEGIFSETPMLVFPGFGDQPTNAYQLVTHNLAVPLVELSFPEISKKLDLLQEPARYEQMKLSLKKSKHLMTSLGGYDKAAEVVEQVATNAIKLVKPPPMINMEQYVYRQLWFYTGVFGAVFASLSGVMLFLCCRLCGKKQKRD